VCGARDLGEALRRIHEGAAMIRTKGEAGTGNIVEAARHWKTIESEIRDLQENPDGCEWRAQTWDVPLALVEETRDAGRLPVVTFVAGGIATPADAAWMMMLGAEAVVHWQEPDVLARVSAGLGAPMAGREIEKLEQRMQERGW
jgi:pyridoxal 5'-phosphate synthase pdxS subunit